MAKIRKINDAAKKNGKKAMRDAQIPSEKTTDKKKSGGMDINRRSEEPSLGGADEFNIGKVICPFLEILITYKKKQNQP